MTDHPLKPGRPYAEDGPMRRAQITMPPRYWDLARRLGHGNMSAGIREALDAAERKPQK